MQNKKKILAYAKLYPPGTNAGAELMLHEILLELKSRGHEVIVAMPNPEIKELDGIDIISYEQAMLRQNYPDIIFTQNHDSRKAMMYANGTQRPIVHFVHNDKAINLFGINKRNSSLIVANSQWVYDSIRSPGVPKIIVNPPTDIKKYQTPRNNANRITFINLIDIKGVDIFWKLARIMPNRQFLAVKGGYGEQKIYEKELPNVKIIENTTDMRSIYEQTRILLVPSKYESWGRVGVEAMASGIPVIASRTPGLLESLGDAAIFVDSEDVVPYFEAITKLDLDEVYSDYFTKSVQRAKDISKRFKIQMDVLEDTINRL